MSQTRRTAGASVLSTSRRLATSSVWRLETPVTLPPGWASLATMPAPTGIAHQREHDRHGLRRVPRGLRGRLLAREDQVDAGLDEGRGGRGHRVELAFGEADVERHVAAVLEAELLEPGLEPLDGRMARRPRRVEDADPERATSLLRLPGGGQPEKHRHGERQSSCRDGPPPGVRRKLTGSPRLTAVRGHLATN